MQDTCKSFPLAHGDDWLRQTMKERWEANDETMKEERPRTTSKILVKQMTRGPPSSYGPIYYTAMVHSRVRGLGIMSIGLNSFLGGIPGRRLLGQIRDKSDV